MLSKILSLLLFNLLIVSSVFAQQTPLNFVRNDNAATTVQSNNGGTSKASTTSKGEIYTVINSNASGGCTKYTFGALVGTVQTVKGTAGKLCGWQLINPAATICYLQIFDVASATTVTLGTTVPDQSFGWPAGAASNVPPSDVGIDFTLGIKIAATTTRANSTPCGTGMDVNLWYK